MIRRLAIPALAAAVALTLGAAAGSAQQMSPQERVAALKAGLAASQQALLQYEWVETTAVLFKGEEKSRQQNQCYYGADGKLQKVVTQAPTAQKKKPGLRGAIQENKKEELTDTMKQAVALVHAYVPPDPARIEAVKAAGKMSIRPSGQQVKIVFADYLKPGDSLAVDMDVATNRLLGVQIASYLATQQDAVNLTVGMATLPDGVTYAAKIDLAAPNDNLAVAVENSGHRKH